jgi:hypothetical protein
MVAAQRPLPEDWQGRYDDTRPIARAGRPEESRCFDRSLAVGSDIAYFVTYHCPNCKLELESEHGGWEGWLKCPVCGTPALPPEILLGHPATKRRVREIGAGGAATATVDADAPEDAAAPDPSALIDPPASTLVSALRMIFLTGLVMSLFLLLIAYLDQNQRAAGIFGSLSVVFFLLLLRMPGRRRKGA